MKILLLGRGGQVGWELQRSLAVLGELVALDFDPAGNPQGLCGDFSNLEGLAETVRGWRPDVIVNSAAHTAVDKAESEPEFARKLNAWRPVCWPPRRSASVPGWCTIPPTMCSTAAASAPGAKTTPPAR
jgi:dTDP-4-dehydrorhamnose reductase